MILVSKCLLGFPCKYNGGSNLNEAVIAFLKDKEYIAVCPEQLGGLPTPRIPSEISGDRVINEEGIDVTLNYHEGAKKAMMMADGKHIEMAILKSNSPSCGKDHVYDGTFTHTLVLGDGIFVQYLKEKNIPVYTEKEI